MSTVQLHSLFKIVMLHRLVKDRTGKSHGLKYKIKVPEMVFKQVLVHACMSVAKNCVSSSTQTFKKK